MRPSVFLCFFLLGVVNNIIYVIILTGALAILGPDCPKGWVLLCDIGPSFLVKLIGPYVVDGAAHRKRVIQCVLTSFLGILTIASTKSMGIILFGISLASYASGLGEMNYLMLSTRYSEQAINGFATGTGGAGIVGSLSWLALTKWAGLDVTLCLLLFTTAPMVMVAAYLNLPKEGEEAADRSSYDLISQNTTSDAGNSASAETVIFDHSALTFKQKLSLARPLLLKFMLPLFIVYWAEYTSNQGVASTLVYSPRPPLLPDLTSYYPTWMTTYQLGVFLSRSSITWFRLDHHLLIVCSSFQCVVLAMLLLESMYSWLGSWAVISIFVIILLEGMLGGLVYVNAYAGIRSGVWTQDRDLDGTYRSLGKSKAFREFSMAIV